jgi:hypothetical protein
MNQVRLPVVLSFLSCALVAAPALAQNQWLSVSDEQGSAGKSCGYGYAVTAAYCTGRYCDNNNLLCNRPQWNYQWVNYASGSLTTAFTSDEYYSSQPWRAVCPTGYVMVGMSANGPYSDNIRTFCQKLDLSGITLPTTGSGWPCYWTNVFLSPISEEGMPFAWASGNGLGIGTALGLSGFRCSGSYCDNMQYTSLWYDCNIIY